MSISRRFFAMPLALAGALYLLPSSGVAAGLRGTVPAVTESGPAAEAASLFTLVKDDRRHGGHDRGRSHRSDGDRHRGGDDARYEKRYEYRDHRRGDRYEYRAKDRHERRHEYREERRHDDYRDERRAYREGYRDGRRYDDHGHYRYYNRWGYRPGHRVPRDRYVVIHDYGHYGYPRPPYGHGYVRIDGDIFLLALGTGLIVSALAY